MKTSTANRLGVGLAQLHTETKKWLGEAHFYLEQIELFQKLIHRKTPYNNVEEQINRDIDLNLSTMADKIHKDTLKRLMEHESSIIHLITSEQNNVCDQEFRESHNFIYHQITDLKDAIKRLKKLVHRFMLQKKFGESPYDCMIAG